MESPYLHHQTNTLIYGISSLIVGITLIALIRNLFCRKSNTEDIYTKKSRHNSRSYADYSRSNASTNHYMPRYNSNSVCSNHRSRSKHLFNKSKLRSISPQSSNRYNDQTQNISKNNEKKILKNETENGTNSVNIDSIDDKDTHSAISTPATSTYTNTSSAASTIPSIPSITVCSPSTASSNNIQLSIVKALNNDAYKPQTSQESFSVSNPTPTPSDVLKPTSPIPQFTPFSDATRGISEILPFDTVTKQNSQINVDTDLDENDDADDKYDTGPDTDGFDTDLGYDTEKERIHAVPSKTNGIVQKYPLPQLNDNYSANRSDIPMSMIDKNNKPWKRTVSKGHMNNRSMSISFSVSNFKLPRMGSITSRPITILKKVLRRMEYGQYDSKDINLSIRATSMFGCIGFLLSLLMLSLYYSLYFDPTWNINLIYISIILYTISKFTIYSCSLCRLYFTFSNSALQYSNCIYFAIMSLMVIHLIISITFGICILNKYFVLSMYFGVVFYIFDILFILVLYILFTKRMFELFENTSSFIAKSKASAYHSKFKSGSHHNNTQSFDFSGTDADRLTDVAYISAIGSQNREDVKDRDTEKSLKKSSPRDMDVIVPSPSPAVTPKFGKVANIPIASRYPVDDGGIESAVRNNNLSIQIEEIQDDEAQDQELQESDNALSPVSLKSPSPKLVVAKSYSCEGIIELTPKNSNGSQNSVAGMAGSLVNDPNKLATRSRGASVSISGGGGRARAGSLSNVEGVGNGRENSHSRSKRETSRIKRERRKDKKEKWKYYQKQQASGIEYVTRYTVLILLSIMSSLAMAGILVYEEQMKFDSFTEDSHDSMEFHLVFAIDVTINCISIYFYFIFGKWLYHLSCCLCHSFIHSCCISLCI